jgi:tetratricopeptide (TPR) repeat protein
VYDTQNKEKWIEEKYYVLIQQHKYNEAIALLQKAPTSKKLQKMLADLYLLKREYTKAATTFKKLFQEAKTYKEKQLYFTKTLDAFLAGGYNIQAANFASKFEDYFIKDKKIRTYILKTYLASGQVERANRFSKKILKKGLSQ